MPKILSFDNEDVKYPLLKQIKDWWDSQDKFFKYAVIITVIIAIVTSATVGIYLTFMQNASNNDRAYWGAYVAGFPSDSGKIDSFEASAGKKASIINFNVNWGIGESTFNPSTMTTLRTRGSIPMITWNPWAQNISDGTYTLASIINGSHDAYITKFAQDSKQWGFPFFLRFAPNMNVNQYPWSEGVNTNTSGQYVAAWKHVHDIFSNLGVGNATWVWSPMAEAVSGSSSFDNFFPGNDYTDWTSVDVYNSNAISTSSTTASPTTPIPTGNPITNLPKGNFDVASCTVFQGWACDGDNYSQPIDIHFYDGAGFSTFIGATTANGTREAAVGTQCGGNSAHGFSFTTPDSLKDGATHQIYAYGINIGSGTNNPPLSSSPISMTCATPTPSPTPIACQLNVVSDTTATVVETGQNAVPVQTPIHPNWTASIPSSTWIWKTAVVEHPTQDETYTFQKEFSWSGTASTALLDIAADNSYRVWLNDVLVGQDATQQNFTSAGQDNYNVLSNLRSGSNKLVVEVKNWAGATSNSSSNPAGTLFKLAISGMCPSNPPTSVLGIATTASVSFSDIFKSSYDKINQLAPGKGFMIAELGSAQGVGDKAAWITDALTTQLQNNFPKVKGVVWYNDSNQNGDFRIDSSPDAKTAFATAISSSYYLSNDFGLFTSSPIPTPASVVPETPPPAAPETSSRQLIMGISMQEGVDSAGADQSAVDASEIAAVESMKTQNGHYPGSFSIWTDIGNGDTAPHTPRGSFPSTNLLSALDSRGITPVIFMQSVGPGIERGDYTNPDNPNSLAAALKYSNSSIAGTDSTGPYTNGQGSFDDYFTAWANAANAYPNTVILRYDQEMNGYWFPWSHYQNRNRYFDLKNTPDNFIASWRHVYTIIHNKAPNVKFLWSPIASQKTDRYDPSSQKTQNMLIYYPGDAYVDYVGFDQYLKHLKPPDTQPQKQTPYQDMVDMYRPIINRIETATNKKFIIGETGISTEYNTQDITQDRVSWIKDGYQAIYSTFHNIVAILYFNINMIPGTQGTDKNWSFSDTRGYPPPALDPLADTTGRMLRAYKTLTDDPRFQGKFPVSVPPPPPPPPGGSSTKEIVDSEDSFVNQAKPAANMNKYNYLISDGSPKQIIYFKFNLGSFSNTGSLRRKTVDKAKLILTLASGPDAPSQASFNVRVGLNNKWKEEEVTFNTRPATNSVVIKSFKGAPKSGTNIEIDLTGYIANYVANINTLGNVLTFSIATPTTTDLLKVLSRESSTGKQPTLIINYH